MCKHANFNFTKIPNVIKEDASILVFDPTCRKTLLSHNEAKSIELASSFKAILLAQIIRLVEENKIPLDKKMQIEDKYVCQDSQYFEDKNLNQVDIDELLIAMMGYSDNTATEVILNILQENKVELTNLRNCELGNTKLPTSIKKLYEKEIYKVATSTPGEIVGFLEVIDEVFLNRTSIDLFWKYMEQEYKVNTQNQEQEKLKFYRKSGHFELFDGSFHMNLLGKMEIDNHILLLNINTGKINKEENKKFEIIQKYMLTIIGELKKYILEL